MKPTWLLPLLPSPQTVVLERVLVEYNGPQIAIWKLGTSELLGVASDEDSNDVRWVAAPVTHTELKALADGAVAIRDLLTKDQVVVFDVDHSANISRLWHCAGNSLNEEHLPEAGARLPRLARAALGVPATGPELCLEGESAAPISFRAVSNVLDVFQRLWRSIAQSVTVQGAKTAGAWSKHLTLHTELSIAGASTGSLVLLVGPSDADISAAVSSHLDAIARAGTNSVELAVLMTSLGPRVQSRYVEMLMRLQAHGLVMLYRNATSSSFLPGYGASRIISALPSEETTKTKPVTVVGSFRAFDTKAKKFILRDESDESYDGDVETGVIEQNPVIAVGDGAVYAATLSPTLRTSGTQVNIEYLLIRIELTQPPK